MIGDEYINQIGFATEREAKVALYKSLVHQYSKQRTLSAYVEPSGSDAGLLAAAVTNRIFGEPAANDFQRENVQLIEGECRKLKFDHDLCVMLSGAAYNASYARYVRAGGSRGMFSNAFLAYIRALSLNAPNRDVLLKAEGKIAKLGGDVLKPIYAMVELGLFRPLPYSPNERQFYEAVQQFALTTGVAVG
jgi:hypothetical protein